MFGLLLCRNIMEKSEKEKIKFSMYFSIGKFDFGQIEFLIKRLLILEKSFRIIQVNIIKNIFSA